MSTAIYYFSGTGNSLYLSRKLALKIKDVELIPIAKETRGKKIKSNAEKVGFVFPLYFWGIPKIVREFIGRIDLKGSKYFFYIVNSGGKSVPDNLSAVINHLLKRKGKILNAAFGFSCLTTI
jgi:hypothetical protein